MSLILATQHLEPLGGEFEQALLGMWGRSLPSGLVCATRRSWDPVNLARGRVYLRLMIDGVVSRGFSATTLAAQLLWFGPE